MASWTDQDWLRAWAQALEKGTAMCRACGDPAKRMKARGFWPGCYCAVCYAEIAHGDRPMVTCPKRWRRLKDRG